MNVADVVIINDPQIPGVIESITRHADGMVVYAVRSLDGTLFAREQEEFTAADQATTDRFRGDIHALVQGGSLHPKLVPAYVSAADGAVFTAGMVDAEVTRTMRARHHMPAGPAPLVLGVNASTNMFA